MTTTRPETTTDPTTTDAAQAPQPTLHVEVFSDIACPWCYIGKRRFAGALAQFEHHEHVRVTFRAYQLSPDAPVGSTETEAQVLSRTKGIPLDQVATMFAQVTSTARSVGLEYDFDTVRPANTFDAHRLVHAAYELAPERAADVVEALFSAHFEQGVAVDDRAELLRIATEVGLDADDVAGVLDSESSAAAVLADRDLAASLGVRSVPFFVFDRRLAVSGAQREEVFLQALTQAWPTAEA